MNRIPRTHIEGALFYVTARGDNEGNIFAGTEDYSVYLELLKKYKEQYGFKLFYFVLLPGHLHLMVELKKGLTISDIMHDLDANYTKYFNAKNQKKGHLFQERYKLVLLEKENYLLSIGAYIHLNPRKIGLTENLSDYPYSSYLYYVSPRSEAPQEEKIKALDLTDEVRVVQEKLGARSYEEFLKSVTPEDMEALGKALSKNLVLGTEEFVKKVEGQSEEPKGLKIEKLKNINKRFVLIGSAVILILGVFNFYLYGRALGLRENLKTKEARFSSEMDDYYKNVSKKLQVEKQKTKALEEKLMRGAK